MLVAVNYHYIRPSFDAPYPSIFGVTPEQFGQQLDELARLGSFVSLAQVADAAAGRAPLPGATDARLDGIHWLITFDDGLAEQAEHGWPMLQDRGIPAAFFVNTRPIVERSVCLVHQIHLVRSRLAPDEIEARIRQAAGDLPDLSDLPDVPAENAARQYAWDTPANARLKYLLNFTMDRSQVAAIVGQIFGEVFGNDAADLAAQLYMSESQMRELSAAGCLGSHGHDHLPLAVRPADDVARDIARSLDVLERITGTRPRAVSYPYGTLDAVSPAVLRAVRAAHVELGFTVEAAGNADLSAPLALARFDCNDAPGGRSCRWPADRFAASIPHATWLREEGK